MQFLAKHGFGIELLGFWPCMQDSAWKQGEEDSDGSTWPNYYYRIGTVSYRIKGQAEVVKTTAVPLVPQSGGDWRAKRAP